MIQFIFTVRCFTGVYKTYFSGIIIYISFDLSIADSNKDSLFQRLRTIEKDGKIESILLCVRDILAY